MTSSSTLPISASVIMPRSFRWMVHTFWTNSFLFGSKFGIYTVLWEQIAPVLSQNVLSLGQNASYGGDRKSVLPKITSFLELLPRKTDADSEMCVDKTIFPGYSLTKAMISTTMGVLVEEGALTWDTRVKDVLPGFQIRDQSLRNFTTIIDLLAHRTGMSTSNYWPGSPNNILIAKENSLKFLNNQQAVKPFRGQWQYKNLGYELAGLVIEQVSGQRWDNVLQSKILEPLGLTRTSAMAKENDGNTTKAYAILDNRTATEIAGVKAAANVFGGAHGGIRSCVKDLLKFYQELMRAGKHQFSTGQTSTPGAPLNQVAQLLSSKIPLKEMSLRREFLCLWLGQVSAT